MKTSDLIRKLNKTTRIKPDICKAPTITTVEIKVGETMEEVIDKEVDKLVGESTETAVETTPQVVPDLSSKLDMIIKQQNRLNSVVNQQDEVIRELTEKVTHLESRLTESQGKKGFLSKVIKKWL